MGRALTVVLVLAFALSTVGCGATAATTTTEVPGGTLTTASPTTTTVGLTTTITFVDRAQWWQFYGPATGLHGRVFEVLHELGRPATRPIIGGFDTQGEPDWAACRNEALAIEEEAKALGVPAGFPELLGVQEPLRNSARYASECAVALGKWLTDRTPTAWADYRAALTRAGDEWARCGTVLEQARTMSIDGS